MFRNTVVLDMRLFSSPVITIPMATKYLNTGYPPAKKAVMYLVSAGILEQCYTKKTKNISQKRSLMYSLEDYKARPKKPRACT